MAGQSNMAGRGPVADVPAIADSRLFMLRCGLWQLLAEPVNPDRGVFPYSNKHLSGISLAPEFVRLYVEETGRECGLIPCAYGGSRISQWQKGEPLYDHALMQTRLAMRSSDLKAILWHQGENDSRDLADVETYEARFTRMIEDFRRDLDMPCLPVVIGELGLFPGGKFPFAAQMNTVLRRIAKTGDRIAIASAQGLTCLDDGMHFTSASSRELGRRYFAAYREMCLNPREHRRF